MERNVFPHPAVAGILREHYVEARLHLDGPEPARSRNNALRERLSGDIARPTYVVLEPKSGRRIAVQKGWLPNPAAFADFLRKAAAAR